MRTNIASGPPPKESVRRRNQDRPNTVLLPAAGREAPAPLWPLKVSKEEDVAEAERQVWEELWHLPQAVQWATTGYRRLLARYTRLLVRAEYDDDLPRAQECRHLEDRLGLNPLAMRRLFWVVDGQALDLTSPPTVPTRGVTKSSEDRRSRVEASLTVLPGGRAG